MSFKATLNKVHNRGVPPVEFLQELVAFGRKGMDSIFAVNSVKMDIYVSVKPELGPYGNLQRRKAVMLEVLRVLAGFESSWRWTEGRDLSANNTSPETEETGIFQVSANSMNFDRSLKVFIQKNFGTADPKTFIRLMKVDKQVAIEYMARLLRFTIRHNGPVLRREINPWLRRDAVEEFERMLA